MKDLLSKIYDYVINYEDDSIKLGVNSMQN